MTAIGHDGEEEEETEVGEEGREMVQMSHDMITQLSFSLPCDVDCNCFFCMFLHVVHL